jgi:Conserved TM helix
MTVLAVDVQGGIAGALTDITSFLVRLAGALLVLLIGYLVAKLLVRATRRVLERVGFNRAVDRGGIRRFLAHSRYEPAQILAKVVFWVVMLCTLQVALAVFGPNPVSGLLDGVVAYLPRVFVAVVVLVAAVALGRFARDVLRGVLRLTPFGHQIAAAVGIAIAVAGCFVALDQLEIAPAIVTGLWYAALVGVVGSAMIAFGVGGIPVARRYLERAANDLDDRFTKLSAVKAAERAAARASRATEAHAAPAATDLTGQPGHGLAKPGVGYPVDPSSAYPSDRSAATYSTSASTSAAGAGPGDTGHYDPSIYSGSSTAGRTQPAGQGRRPDGGTGRADDHLAQPGAARPYGEVASSARGGYPPERPGAPRPPGDQRRPSPQPPGGQGTRGPGDVPRGTPRPFDDSPSRPYGPSDPRPDDAYRDPPGTNGYGDYPYPR